MPAATVLSSVSTAGIDEGERLAFWEHHNAEALVGLTCRTYAAEGLLARQVNVALGPLRVADIAGNPHVIERAPALVRSRPKDALFVSLLLEGEGFFYHSGGCLVVGAGDVVVYRTDQPYLFGFGRDMRQLLVDVPHEVLAERRPGLAVATPQPVAGTGAGASSATARALRELLLGAVSAPAAAPGSVGDQALDLIEVMLTGRGTPVDAARVRAARAHADEHLQDPGLCADSVARALGVTARHLNRALAVEDTTVTQLIQHRRLEAARRHLSRPGAHDDRIGDVASRWGFGSQAHFTRLFRAAYGCTPTQYRTERTARP
ncbi:AraC family transcriptional regulator [Blastococcus sp. BMG 814]|uniref:AraC family transcriptional regulator n=1 Tax=Blastococcus carthaginiensis TaxID=3050034 RepID=A0ABT9IDL4_9ACTN|nr:AraC family transcriptional regulator [Blastococcus carthaginiensis]MDP5183648.1 AraC family transcriptional regulator [Blastococcus carthaginiensis]